MRTSYVFVVDMNIDSIATNNCIPAAALAVQIYVCCRSWDTGACVRCIIWTANDIALILFVSANTVCSSCYWWSLFVFAFAFVVCRVCSFALFHAHHIPFCDVISSYPVHEACVDATLCALYARAIHQMLGSLNSVWRMSTTGHKFDKNAVAPIWGCLRIWWKVSGPCSPCCVWGG